jgi:hypothetical protein
MVSYTPLNSALNSAAHADIPRRDLLAIFAFLNRRNEMVKDERDPFEHAEGVLQELAAAARMQ